MAKGTDSTYRPSEGVRCLVSGPNCDDDNGHVFGEVEILWEDGVFVLYHMANTRNWPVLHKWDHVIAKPLESVAV